MDSHRFRIETEFMLTTGFWLLTTRKTVRFCNWLRIPPVRNQAAVLVQASGKRQIIAVLQNGGAVMRKAIQDGCAVVHLRSQSIGCSRSISNRLPAETGEEPINVGQTFLSGTGIVFTSAFSLNRFSLSQSQTRMSVPQ
jgi:hypothetical protein